MSTSNQSPLENEDIRMHNNRYEAPVENSGPKESVMSESFNLKNVLQKLQNEKNYADLNWSGSFDEYLDLSLIHI